MRVIFHEEDEATAVVARLRAGGFDAEAVRERFAGEDDDEDHPWAVVTDAPELVVEILAEEYDGWVDHDDPPPPPPPRSTSPPPRSASSATSPTESSRPELAAPCAAGSPAAADRTTGPTELESDGNGAPESVKRGVAASARSTRRASAPGAGRRETRAAGAGGSTN